MHSTRVTSRIIHFQGPKGRHKQNEYREIRFIEFERNYRTAAVERTEDWGVTGEGGKQQIGPQRVRRKPHQLPLIITHLYNGEES